MKRHELDFVFYEMTKDVSMKKPQPDFRRYEKDLAGSMKRY